MQKSTYRRVRMDSAQHWRIRLTALVLGLLGFLGVAARLAQLMVVDYDYYAAKALNNQTRSTAAASDRGLVYDRNMNILASSVGVENVYLDPHELKQSKADIPAIADFLAEVLDKDAPWIQTQAADLKRRYKQVGSCISEEKAQLIRTYIQAHDVSGIHLEPTSVRVYPNGKLAAQVIGFTP